ncbi:MFS domain-containing protein [Favolaschia claudopus]|uniref:MFS domain-containing protein n=1 Tax=Favolaschia claudopus TaxID=2862362 RepID=A0AAW0EI30_9AGAR
MSLQPITLELCQGSALRDRRRSSIRPQNFLPLLFTAEAHSQNQNESAIADDIAPLYESKAPPTPDSISPISHAHVSGHLSSFSTSRHQDVLSLSKSESTDSPSASSATTTDSYFEPRQTTSKDLRLRYRLASVIFLYFLNGWGDGVTGTALPYFRAQFHLSYMTSSLLFVATMCGFMSGTFCVPRVMNFLGLFYFSTTRLGFFSLSPWKIAFSRVSPKTFGHSASQARYLMLILASFGSPIAFILMGCKIGLPAMAAAYVTISFARALLTASLNVFLAEQRSKCLGYAYGVWSFGATVAPLVFQATAASLPWANFYFGSLVLSAASFVFLGITFYPTIREFTADRKAALVQTVSHTPPLTPETDDVADIPDTTLAPSTPAPPSTSLLRLIVTVPFLWSISLFSLVYCGSETTTQGLVVQYLLASRHANPNTVGFVSAGFWGGITVSRVAWSFFSSKISFTGRKYIVQVCLGLALGMHLLMFLVNSFIENAFSASLIGLFFGPIFPACLELGIDLLPPELTMPSMAIISAAGSLGNAILPFVTGVITTKYGMRDWSYMTITQTTVLFCTWFLFPTRQPLRRGTITNLD